MSNTILQINFKFNVHRAAYEEAVSPLAEPIADVSGLRWKIWLMNEGASEAGGILCFADHDSLQAYLEGPIANKIANHPALSEMSIKQFEVMEDVSAITRAPVESEVTA